MTAELLSSLVAILLSILASYLPGFSGWYDPLSPNAKRLIMLGLLSVTSAASFAIACAGYGDQIGIAILCSEEGAITLLKAFIAAVIANQSAYAISPRAAG